MSQLSFSNFPFWTIDFLAFLIILILIPIINSFFNICRGSALLIPDTLLKSYSLRIPQLKNSINIHLNSLLSVPYWVLGKLRYKIYCWICPPLFYFLCNTLVQVTSSFTWFHLHHQPPIWILFLNTNFKFVKNFIGFPLHLLTQFCVIWLHSWQLLQTHLEPLSPLPNILQPQ